MGVFSIPIPPGRTVPRSGWLLCRVPSPIGGDRMKPQLPADPAGVSVLISGAGVFGAAAYRGLRETDAFPGVCRVISGLMPGKTRSMA